MTAPGARWRHWLDRFGWPELVGLAGGYFGYFVAHHLGVGTVIAAYCAAMGENLGYYALVFARDWQALDPGRRSFRRVLGAMIHDFGFAEVLDTAILRPGLTWLAVRWLGSGWGVGLAKFAADAVFYALTILFYERRLDRENRRDG